MNLVKNALKFTTQGFVSIKACHMNGLLVVNVEDTGAGITREDMPKLFTRFGKLQRTAQMNSEGIGLGLTMVKQIVETSGGSVGVYSGGIDKGSVFSFTMEMSEVDPVEPNNNLSNREHEENPIEENVVYPKAPIVCEHDDGFITFRDETAVIVESNE